MLVEKTLNSVNLQVLLGSSLAEIQRQAGICGWVITLPPWPAEINLFAKELIQ
jgi:hypothetical protein